MTTPEERRKMLAERKERMSREEILNVPGPAMGMLSFIANRIKNERREVRPMFVAVGKGNRQDIIVPLPTGDTPRVKDSWGPIAKAAVLRNRSTSALFTSSVWISEGSSLESFFDPNRPAPSDDPNHKHAAIVTFLQRATPNRMWVLEYELASDGRPMNAGEWLVKKELGQFVHRLAPLEALWDIPTPAAVPPFGSRPTVIDDQFRRP